MFFHPTITARKYLKIAEILREIGIKSKFLSAALFFKEYDLFRFLVHSGAVDCNEQPFQDKNILFMLIDASWDISHIEALIDHGANVNFPPGFKYSNAYLQACRNYKYQKQGKFLAKIESKLNEAGRIAVLEHRKFVEEIRVKYSWLN